MSIREWGLAKVVNGVLSRFFLTLKSLFSLVLSEGPRGACVDMYIYIHVLYYLSSEEFKW